MRIQVVSRRFWVICLVLLLIVQAGIQCYHWQRFVQTPVHATAPNLVVEHGDSWKLVLRKIRQAGIEDGQDWQWMLMAYDLDISSHIKPGEYALTPALTPHALLVHLRQGLVIQYRFTVVEGWTMHQLRTALGQAPELVHSQILSDDRALMTAMGAVGQSPEGRFLPETYLYHRGDSDLSVLRRAYQAMATTLAQIWQTRDPQIPLSSPNEALILASLIEKETSLAAERNKIAGVFIRRLQRGMRLQTDPTVIYGLGARYTGNLTHQDLQTDTPYNTYTRSGLTPTPIAMPGAAALSAAVHPEPGDTLYFVAIGDRSKGHVFSATLEQHRAAINQYLQHVHSRHDAPATH